MCDNDDDFIESKRRKTETSGASTSSTLHDAKVPEVNHPGPSKVAEQKSGDGMVTCAKKKIASKDPNPTSPGINTSIDDGERIPLSSLIGDGITESDLERLRGKGLCTIEAVAYSSSRQLCKIQGISEKKAIKLIATARKIVPTGFSTGNVLFERRSDVLQITSGSSNLDNLLQGGFETGSLIEIFGENRAGKTQICMTLAVTCQLPVDRGGAEGKCLFIDTEGTFRPEKLVPIAQRFKLDPSMVLENVVSARSFNSEHQSELLVHASALMSESRFALLIVDSATNLFRCEFTGRGELYERQSNLSAFLHQLRQVCDQYGVAMVYTNQVVSDCSGLGIFTGNANKAVGGNIMGHASTTRLSLRKGRGENRVCKVYSSPTIPESEATFCITSGGIDDPTDI